MATFEMQEWPLVFVEVAHGPGKQETWAPWKALAAAIDRGGEFAFVIAMPPAIPEPSQPAERMKWLKRCRPLFIERCRGIAYVMSSPEGVAHAEHWLRASRTAYGCPVEVFGESLEAVAWAKNGLEQPTAEAQGRS